jgi:DNA-binding MarR family transcriptional regulator
LQRIHTRETPDLAVSSSGVAEVRRYGVPECASAWDSVDYLLADWARERPDLDFNPVAVINRLGRVRSILQQRMAEVFAGHGLTAADFLVVVTLRRVGVPHRMPQARLMDALGLTSGTVSLRLGRLVKAGIVTRVPDPDDRRGSVIELTENGLRLFDQLAPEHLANEDRLLSALDEQQRATLAGLLRHLLVSLEPPRPSPQCHLGMSVEPAATARKRRAAVGLVDMPGLLVSNVDEGSPAHRAGIERGDLVIEIAGRAVLSAVTLTEVVSGLTGGDSAEIVVLRGDRQHRVLLRV